MKPLSIFLGYDEREHAAYEVACSSILRRASQPVLITPLYLPHLTHIIQRYIQRSPDGRLWCPISEAGMSTEFAISRFCVPFIQETGWALYADCDILCLSDISELFALADEQYAVMVVKHDHQVSDPVKMDGQIQQGYPRKNWSSVVLWNCEHDAHRRLTRERLSYWPGRDLHAFKWLKDEEIGSLPEEWNHLVGISKRARELKMLHYTSGGPWVKGWKGGLLDHIWESEYSGLRVEVMA